MTEAPPDILAGETMPPAPRQTRSRLKREALLQAALTLFWEQGYEAVSVEAIARRAGVAVGAFYQHFASKRQLVLVLMAALLREAATLTGPAGAGELTDPRAAITILVRQGLQTDWAYVGAYRAWREIVPHDSYLQALNRQIENWTAGRLEGLLRLLVLAPGARSGLDLPILARALSLLFWRLVEEPIHEPHLVDALVNGLADLIYHALFTDAAEGGRAAETARKYTG